MNLFEYGRCLSPFSDRGSEVSPLPQLSGDLSRQGMWKLAVDTVSFVNHEIGVMGKKVMPVTNIHNEEKLQDNLDEERRQFILKYVSNDENSENIVETDNGALIVLHNKPGEVCREERYSWGEEDCGLPALYLIEQTDWFRYENSGGERFLVKTKANIFNDGRNWQVTIELDTQTAGSKSLNCDTLERVVYYPDLDTNGAEINVYLRGRDDVSQKKTYLFDRKACCIRQDKYIKNASREMWLVDDIKEGAFVVRYRRQDDETGRLILGVIDGIRDGHKWMDLSEEGIVRRIGHIDKNSTCQVEVRFLPEHITLNNTTLSLNGSTLLIHALDKRGGEWHREQDAKLPASKEIFKLHSYFAGHYVVISIVRDNDKKPALYGYRYMPDVGNPDESGVNWDLSALVN